MCDGIAEGFPCALLCGSEVILEFGEELLDRVEVGRVFGQEEQLGAGLTYRLAHGVAFVAAEIIHDDDVARCEGWGQHLGNIDAKALAVDGTVDHPRCVDPVVAECCQKGCGVPVSERGLTIQAFTARAPASQRRHVGFHPGFVNENETGRVDAWLIFQPLLPAAPDIGTALLSSDQCLFLCVSPCSCTKVQTAQ